MSDTSNVRDEFKEIFENDSGVAKLLVGDVIVHERWLCLNGFRVDEEAAVILLFEELEIVAIGVGSVVDENNLQFPFNILFIGHVIHVLLRNIIGRKYKNHEVGQNMQ